MNKKLAIILPGLTRVWKQTYPSFFEFLEKSFNEWDIDIYISTWNITGRQNNTVERIDTSSLSKEEQKNIVDVYNPKKFVVKDFEFWKKEVREEVDNFIERHRHNKYYNFIFYSFFAQFFHIYENFNLIDNYENYDAILKFRFDCIINPNKFDFNFDNITVFDHWTRSPRCSLIGYRDFFVVGNPHIMKTYSTLYNYFRNAPVDKFSRGYRDCYISELVLYDLLNENNITVDLNKNLNPKIIR